MPISGAIRKPASAALASPGQLFATGVLDNRAHQRECADVNIREGAPMLARQNLLLLGGLAGFHLIGAYPRSADAQAPASYSVSGVVHDETNAPVTSAQLKLARGGHLEQSATTGADGRFRSEERRVGKECRS